MFPIRVALFLSLSALFHLELFRLGCLRSIRIFVGMFFVVCYQFVLRQKSSPRSPGSFHGVAMPGFVHVGFLPAAGVGFLALFPEELPLLVEVFLHLGPCLPAF